MWNTILNALGWILAQIYLLIPDFAAAVILFSLAIKLILLPFGMKSKKGMMRMQAIQPKTKALEAKYKDDKERYNLEVQKLYKEEKVNPLGGCLWTLLPFPILIALYQVIRLPLSHMMGMSGADIEVISNLPAIADYLSALGTSAAEIASNQLPLMNAIHENFSSVMSALPVEIGSKLFDISFNFFGLNLSHTPSYTILNWYWILPIVSGLSAWAQTIATQKMNPSQTEQQGSMKMMTYMGPVMSLVFGFSLPAIMSLYWASGAVFSLVQDFFLTLYYRKKLGIPSPAEMKQRELEERENLARQEQIRQERLQRLAENGPQATKRSNMSNKKYRQLKEQQQQKIAKPADITEDIEDTEEFEDEPEISESDE